MSASSLGTFGGSLLNMFFVIYAGRLLGPDQLGVVVLALTILFLVDDISSLAFGTALVRFAGRSGSSAFAWVNHALSSSGKMIGFITIGGVVVSWPLAHLIWRDERLLLPLLMVFVLFGGFFFFQMVVSGLQAQRRFMLRASLQIANGMSRIGGLFVLSTAGFVTIPTTLLLYVVPPIILGIIGYGLLRIVQTKGVLSAVEQQEFRSMHRWMRLFFLLTALSSRVDTFFLFRLATSEHVGIYQAAQQLFLFLYAGAGALSTVFAPIFAKAKGLVGLKHAFWQLSPYVGVALIALLVIFPWVDELARLAYGDRFVGIGVIASVRLIAVIIGAIVTIPFVTYLIYHAGDTRFLSYHAIGILLLAIGANALLIPPFGAMGAAAATVIIAASSLVPYAIRTFVLLKKEESNG